MPPGWLATENAPDTGSGPGVTMTTLLPRVSVVKLHPVDSFWRFHGPSLAVVIRFRRLYRCGTGRFCGPWPETPADARTSDGVPDRHALPADSRAGPVRCWPAGAAPSRPAGQPGRRGLHPRHSAVLRQPLPADPQRHRQAWHHHTLWRCGLPDRLAVSGAGGLEADLTLASDMRTNGAF